MRSIFLGLFLLVGCMPEQGATTVSISVTPISLTRPCFVGKVAVFDDAGQEYRASTEEGCNEGVIELVPGRAFAGMVLESAEIEAVSVTLF